MKTFTRITGIVLLLLTVKTSFAQYYEFVENKGQWDGRVKFQGNIPNGNFYLEASGYKIVQHNGDDLNAVSEFYGGHFHNHQSTPGNPGGGSGHPGTPDYHTASASKAIPGGGGSSGSVTVRSHAYEVTFVGASRNATIIPEKPLESYYNYFTGSDSSKWAPGCKIYQAVTYKNVYPNIDVRYYSDNNQLKYDIIVNPGGNINDIALQIDGADKVEIKKKELVIRTSTGDVTEKEPYTYEVTTGGRKTVDAAYVVKGNIVKFKVGSYSGSGTLVIDPTLVFCTFTGSTADNWGFTATYDGYGNFYAGGIVFGNGFPISTGAYQTTFSGGNREDNGAPCDVAIIKFSANGNRRLYATYLGGSGNEQPHSMIVDNANNLIIAGRTNSTNFPMTVAKPYGDGGGFDIFLTKLNAAGTGLVGSLRIGGTGDDGVNIAPKYDPRSGGSRVLRPNYGDDARSEVITDEAGNIYLAAQTRSSNFLTTAGAFQTSLSGEQDAVIIKASFNVTDIQFSSYLGGGGLDAAFVLALRPQDNNIYVAGATSSKDFPGTGNGPVMNSSNQGGDSDGFVSILRNNGRSLSLVKTSYFGTDKTDLIFGIQFDRYGFPYIMGTTTGNWPVVNAAFSQTGGKQFISKLNPELTQWQYSTIFGTNSDKPNISPTAFLVDRCENVYVSGWGGGINNSESYNENSGTRGLTTTPDAEVANTLGRDGADFYFFVLKKNAESQLYGSMFGQTGGLGDHVDGGTSRFDKQGIIYQSICANCGGSPAGERVIFPTTANAFAPNNGTLQTQGSKGCNLAAVKISFNLAGIGASVRASIDGTVRRTGCIPLTVDFRDTIAMAKTYVWNFADGSPEVTTTTPAISHTFTQVGTYRVRLIGIDQAACNGADTAYIEIKAGNNRATLDFTSRKLTPPCDQLNYEFTNTSTATKPFLDTSFVWDMGDNTILRRQPTTFTHQYTTPGTYNVTLRLADTSYCNYPDEVVKQLRIAINVKAQFETPASGCHPYTAVFNNTSLGGQEFKWDFGDGTTSTETYPEHEYAAPGTYYVTLIAIDPSTCNGSDTLKNIRIIVSPGPTAGFTYTPTTAKQNTPYDFTNTSTGAISYLWLFGDGEGIATTKRDTAISHVYNATGQYDMRLIVENEYGCRDTMNQKLDAIILPLVDVPNAFTPNRDGINDRVTLRGFGIARMAFRIFNRWGVMVYESVSYKDAGWDGYYRGVLQPQDVYGYIADIEFSDGKRYQKKGDITLLR